jgi:hypothetical protein
MTWAQYSSVFCFQEIDYRHTVVTSLAVCSFSLSERLHPRKDHVGGTHQVLGTAEIDREHAGNRHNGNGASTRPSKPIPARLFGC